MKIRLNSNKALEHLEAYGLAYLSILCFLTFEVLTFLCFTGIIQDRTVMTWVIGALALVGFSCGIIQVDLYCYLDRNLKESTVGNVHVMLKLIAFCGLCVAAIPLKNHIQRDSTLDSDAKLALLIKFLFDNSFSIVVGIGIIFILWIIILVITWFILEKVYYG